ncbi:MAG: hypothetical protein Q9187_002535 [Circinaria calcarea]
MFSSLFQNVRVFLSRSSLTVEHSHSLAADRQIKADLAIAADEGMATTRLEDHALAATEVLYDDGAATQESATRKRANEDESSNTLEQLSPKRRRANCEPATELADTGTPARRSSMSESIRIKAPVTEVLEDVASANADDLIEDRNPSQHHETPAVAEVSESRTNSVDGTASASTIFSDHIGLVNMDDSKETSSADTLVNGRDPEESTSGKSVKTKKSKPGVKRNNETKLQKSPKSAKRAARKSDINHVGNEATNKKPTHKRFGSEELKVEILEKPSPSEASEVTPNASTSHHTTIEDDSEDDAPEVISASAGLFQSRVAAADAAKAVERQEKKNRKKRQVLDARLKEQAKSAKRQKRKEKSASSESDPDATIDDPLLARVGDDRPGAAFKFNSEGPLPLHLPDEILASKPVIRLPTPPPDSRSSKSHKHRFIDMEPKPPKDIKRGSLRIRVLEDNTSTLPPRASKVSKSLKESWLTGRRGPRGGVGSLRRKMGGGFLRK